MPFVYYALSDLKSPLNRSANFHDFLSQVDLNFSMPYNTVAEIEIDQSLTGRTRIDRHVFEISHHLSHSHLIIYRVCVTERESSKPSGVTALLIHTVFTGAISLPLPRRVMPCPADGRQQILDHAAIAQMNFGHGEHADGSTELTAIHLQMLIIERYKNFVGRRSC